MDPSELGYVTVIYQGRTVDVPVMLERSEAVCEAAGRPAELVIGDMVKKYTSMRGDTPPKIMEVLGKVGPLELVKPIWVAAYRPTDSEYCKYIGARKIIVVYKENVQESESRLTRQDLWDKL